MLGDRGQFLESCGATGPLALEWVDPSTGSPVRREFAGPSILVGRDPAADLVLDDPRVGLRHAYLQLVEGRLYAIDLGGGDGLRWGGVPRAAGWVDRRRPVQIGGTTLRVVGGDRTSEDGPGPAPTSSRFVSRQSLPGVVLESRGRSGKAWRWPMDRVLVLVGRARVCKLRVPDPGVAPVVCALIRNALGVWVVDLLGAEGVAVNGAVCREIRLEDGDLLRAGSLAFRIYYDGLTTFSPLARPAAAALGYEPGLDRLAARSGLGLPGLPAGVGDRPADLLATQSVDTLSTAETILRPFVEGGGAGHDLASAPFGEALTMLLRLFGDLQRGHLDMVRQELEQIRLIGREMVALRTGGGSDAPVGSAGAMPTNGVGVPGPFDDDAGPDIEDAPPRRPDPRVVHEVVGQRLAAWERERQSRWRKVVNLLIRQ